MIFIIDYPSIIEGTIHVLTIYLFVLAIFIYLFLFSKGFDNVFKKLDKASFSKEDSGFYLNYIAIIILIIIISFSAYIIGFRELRADNFPVFVLFAILSFLIMPIAIGLFGLYSYIIKNEGYNLGRTILLGISFICLGLYGSNLHDIIWCGVHTNWYQEINLAGDDIAFFFYIFGIYDENMIDYRRFGFYAFWQVLIELAVGMLAFYKFYKLNEEENQKRERKPYIISFTIMFLSGTTLGIIEFIFDSPWFFTALEYKIDVYIGIPVITLLFILIGFYLGDNSKTSRRIPTKKEVK